MGGSQSKQKGGQPKQGGGQSKQGGGQSKQGGGQSQQTPKAAEKQNDYVPNKQEILKNAQNKFVNEKEQTPIGNQSMIKQKNPNNKQENTDIQTPFEKPFLTAKQLVRTSFRNFQQSPISKLQVLLLNQGKGPISKEAFDLLIKNKTEQILQRLISLNKSQTLLQTCQLSKQAFQQTSLISFLVILRKSEVLQQQKTKSETPGQHAVNTPMGDKQIQIRSYQQFEKMILFLLNINQAQMTEQEIISRKIIKLIKSPGLDRTRYGIKIKNDLIFQQLNKKVEYQNKIQSIVKKQIEYACKESKFFFRFFLKAQQCQIQQDLAQIIWQLFASFMINQFQIAQLDAFFKDHYDKISKAIQKAISYFAELVLSNFCSQQISQLLYSYNDSIFQVKQQCKKQTKSPYFCFFNFQIPNLLVYQSFNIKKYNFIRQSIDRNDQKLPLLITQALDFSKPYIQLKIYLNETEDKSINRNLFIQKIGFQMVNQDKNDRIRTKQLYSQQTLRFKTDQLKINFNPCSFFDKYIKIIKFKDIDDYKVLQSVYQIIFPLLQHHRKLGIRAIVVGEDYVKIDDRMINQNQLSIDMQPQFKQQFSQTSQYQALCCLFQLNSPKLVGLINKNKQKIIKEHPSGWLRLHINSIYNKQLKQNNENWVKVYYGIDPNNFKSLILNGFRFNSTSLQQMQTLKMQSFSISLDHSSLYAIPQQLLVQQKTIYMQIVLEIYINRQIIHQQQVFQVDDRILAHPKFKGNQKTKKILAINKNTRQKMKYISKEEIRISSDSIKMGFQDCLTIFDDVIPVGIMTRLTRQEPIYYSNINSAETTPKHLKSLFEQVNWSKQKQSKQEKNLDSFQHAKLQLNPTNPTNSQIFNKQYIKQMNQDTPGLKKEKYTKYPYNCLGQIRFVFKDNLQSHGTGFLIEKRFVMALAKNLFFKNNLAKEIYFNYGHKLKKKSIRVKNFLYPKQYYQSQVESKQQWNFILLQLTEQVQLQKFIVINKINNFSQLNVIILGFSDKKSNILVPHGFLKEQFDSSAIIIHENQDFLYFNTQLQNGCPGGPILRENEQKDWQLIGISLGILNSKKLQNQLIKSNESQKIIRKGLKINSRVYNKIKQWMIVSGQK